MTEPDHPNLTLVKKLNIQDLDACTDIVSDDFTWHYFNPRLPDLEGQHHGIEGLKQFFAKLNEASNGSFELIKTIGAYPAGDELVITHVCNHVDIAGNSIEFDAVVVWRVVNNRITEAWDIPAINTVRAR